MTHPIKKQDHTESGLSDQEELEEDRIAAWLRDKPNFFNRHSDLLPAAISGKVLSLEAGQLNQLRRQNEQLRNNLDDMLARIRRNEDIFRHFYVTQVGMITADSPAALLREATESSEKQFKVFRITVAISDREEGLNALLAPLMRQEESRITTIKHNDLFNIFGKSGDPVIRIGREGHSRHILFGRVTTTVRSEALIPLYIRQNANSDHTPRLIGSLNLGGDTLNRFLPSDATDLLRDMADIFTISLCRFLNNPDFQNDS